MTSIDFAERIGKLEAENARLRDALRPFCEMAGELFARNWNRSDLVLGIDNPERENRVTAGDFFDARAALTREPQP